jgi:hypothetical protein
MHPVKPSTLLPLSSVFAHLARNIVFGLLFIAIGLWIGMLGYHTYEQMSWVDAFVNAAMILSGMGPVSPLTTAAGKLFAGFYALFSGLAFIAIVAIVFAPLVHRFFHKLHLDMNE